jgi:hypothetical protein
MQNPSDPQSDKASAPPPSTPGTSSDFSRPVVPISELLTRPEFPKAALGELVDIGGYTGVVIAVVNQSLKVKSHEGTTKSFNAHGLRKIYGPPERPEPSEMTEESTPAASPAPVAAEPEAPPPAKVEVLTPDFSRAVKPIADLVRHPGYPQSLLGEHVQVGGFTGVVVAIVNRSLKVRSPAEITRSYNADALRRLHGG